MSRMLVQTKSFTWVESAWVFKPGLVSLNQTRIIGEIGFFGGLPGGYLIADEQPQGVTNSGVFMFNHSTWIKLIPTTNIGCASLCTCTTNPQKSVWWDMSKVFFWRIQRQICNLRSYGFFTTKIRDDLKKDHLPWQRALRDEKNRLRKKTTTNWSSRRRQEGKAT